MTRNKWTTRKYMAWGIYCDDNEIDKENLQKIQDVAAHKPQTRMKWCLSFCDWFGKLRAHKHKYGNECSRTKTNAQQFHQYGLIQYCFLLAELDKCNIVVKYITIYRCMRSVCWKQLKTLDWFNDSLHYRNTYTNAFQLLLIVLGAFDIFVYLENLYRRNHWSDRWLEANTATIFHLAFFSVRI